MDSKNLETPELEPSKSQRKRDARLLFELARDLVDMSRKQLSPLPIEADLRDAIDHASSITAHVARKRQVQFVAKMMRNRDVQAIQQALDDREIEARQLTVRHHRVEIWRDRLLAEGDMALGELIRHLDASDVQSIRHLIRNAKRESEKRKPPASARKLFKLLREMDAEKDLPASLPPA